MALTLLAAALGGCAAAAQPPFTVVHAAAAGRHGDVRVELQRHLPADPRDRLYLLQRINLAAATLADGYPDAGERTFERIFDTLRTQGINADKTVASVVINEDLKFWKGEPFEQAMAFLYVGLHHAVRGDWSNLRAATDNSLFNLRDFGPDDSGRPHDTESLVLESARDDPQDPHLGTYEVRESNFTLGYLLSAIANQQMGRSAEADEQYARARGYAPRLAGLIDALRSGAWNTLFVLDWGEGPRKVATGPDRAIAAFEPVMPSGNEPLVVTAGGRSTSYPVVTDLNRLAVDHMWNSLEEMRVAKSHLGTLLMLGGALTTAHGVERRDERVALAGVGLLLAGALAKGGAHADTRYCEMLPQRVYVAPARVSSAADRVTLEVQGIAASRLVLTGIEPPADGSVQLRYLRPPWRGGQPVDWAASGRIHYAADHTTQVDALPYILGGRCVRKPTEAVLASYQRAGNLTDLTLNDLWDLYRAEGIRWDDDDAGGQPGLHVLEGGQSLAAPLPGTVGFARLFGQLHGPYLARSMRVVELTEKLRGRGVSAFRAMTGSARDQDLYNALVAKSTHAPNRQGARR